MIAAADAVIFGADLEVRDRHRFEGKPLVQVSVKKAISDAPAIIEQAVAAAKAGVPAGVAAGGPLGAPGGPALASKVTSDARTAPRCGSG